MGRSEGQVQAEVPQPHRSCPWPPLQPPGGRVTKCANPHCTSDPQTPARESLRRPPPPRGAAATRVGGMREPPSPGEFPRGRWAAGGAGRGLEPFGAPALRGQDPGLSSKAKSWRSSQVGQACLLPVPSRASEVAGGVPLPPLCHVGPLQPTPGCVNGAKGRREWSSVPSGDHGVGGTT